MKTFEERMRERRNYCKQKHEVLVLQSAAGYYIGTLDDGVPNCRLSEQYYRTEEQAKQALDDRTFVERESEEVLWCNGSTGKCLI